MYRLPKKISMILPCLQGKGIDSKKKNMILRTTHPLLRTRGTRRTLSTRLHRSNHTDNRMEQREGFSETAPNFECTNQIVLHQLNKLVQHRKILIASLTQLQTGFIEVLYEYCTKQVAGTYLATDGLKGS